MSSPAFDLLHERLRHWVWRRGWTDLHEVQQAAITAVLSERSDVVISAGTAAGKTEAAFLPVCSSVATVAGEGLRALYLAPLKALINDQFARLEELCRDLDVAVHRWHGDVPASAKKRLLQDPRGILLITPESLEAVLALHGTRVGPIFAGLGHVIIDELHAFLGTERGRQLQSLLHRIDEVRGATSLRIGLSATLGDPQLAASFLRPSAPEGVRQIVADGAGSSLQLQVRAYTSDTSDERLMDERAGDERAGDERAGDVTEADVRDDASSRAELARDLYRVLRGTSNLIFANSRREVEAYAELLREFSERARVPNEFWPHHGSLSAELRESVESGLKDAYRPLNALCTTTMEMGIDLGRVDSVAQVGAPSSVAGLRQRLGRSGRRGGPSKLRIYVREPRVDDGTPLEQRLRPELVQTVAAVQLLLAGWCEPPLSGALHLSTLVQQLLSLIAERSGVRPGVAWRILCERGPFGEVDGALFKRFLRSLGAHELISQMHEGTLVLGLAGERLVNHYSFYAAFETSEEYSVVCAGKRLGTLPLERPWRPGMFIVFGGRSWMVVDADAGRRELLVRPGPGGRPPQFSGGGAPTHDRIRAQMHAVLQATDEPAFLNSTARALLEDGREHFARWDLVDRGVVAQDDDVLLFPWIGDRALQTLALQLASAGFAVEPSGVALRIARAELRRVEEQLQALADAGPGDAVDLAQTVPVRSAGKHDEFLSDELLTLEYAALHLDTEGAWRAVERLTNG